MRYSQTLSNLRWILFAVFVVALLWSFVVSPDDAILKSSQRIFYIHFGSAIACFIAFAIGWAAAIAYLVKRNLGWDRLSAAGAEVGLVFATCVLVSGSIWARVAWNTWWTWDPRLVTTAVLWFLYVAYFVLRAFFAEDRRRQAVAGALFSLFAFLDVPVVFFSVNWWTSIHPKVITESGINISSPAMVTAMMLFLVAMILLAADLMWLRWRQHTLADRLEAARAELRSY